MTLGVFSISVAWINEKDYYGDFRFADEPIKSLNLLKIEKDDLKAAKLTTVLNRCPGIYPLY